MQGQRQRIVLWAAVLGAAAAFAPAARADDGTQPLPIAVPDATALMESALEATDPDTVLTEMDEAAVVEIVEEVEEAVEQVPAEPVAVVEPATPTAETAAPAPEAPAATAETAAATTETPVPAPETAVNPVATPAASPAQPVPTAAAQQVQPANVNVSIRVESPGDNGAVSQINGAIANVVAEFTAAAAPVAQYQPAESQYQAPAAPVAAAQPTQPAQQPAAPESPTTTTSAPAPAPAEQWDWTWQWSCGEAISPEIVLPANSAVPIWNWNWDWNCGAGASSGENTQTQLPTQYQASATQYQPMNVNISIRILSPGNDGAVTQTNVAQANVAATIVSTTTQLVTQILQPVLQPAPAPGSSTAPTTPAAGAGAQPASAASGEIGAAIVELAAAIAGVPVELAVELVCCELVWATPGFGGADETRPARPAGQRTLGSAARGMPFGPTAGEGSRRDAAPSALAAAAPVTPEAIEALAAPRPAVEAARRAQAAERLKQRAALKSAPIRDRATTLASAGVTPLGAPDRSFKLFFLFLLPFAFALVDAARRVVGEQHPAAADPGRPKERPG